MLKTTLMSWPKWVNGAGSWPKGYITTVIVLKK